MLNEYGYCYFSLHRRDTVQVQYKAALSLFIESEPQLSKEDCIDRLREDLSVEVLYSIDALKGPTTLYRIIRVYLSLNGVPYKQHPGSTKIAFGLVNIFFIDEEDRTYAFVNFARLRGPPAGTQTLSSALPQTITVGTSHTSANNDKRHAHNMASRFKSGDRFPVNLVRICKNTSKITLMLVQITISTMNRN